MAAQRMLCTGGGSSPVLSHDKCHSWLMATESIDSVAPNRLNNTEQRQHSNLQLHTFWDAGLPYAAT